MKSEVYFDFKDASSNTFRNILILSKRILFRNE